MAINGNTASASPELKISIITPSFNQAAFLEEALDSVRQQDYPAIEHIVIDGGSTDGSAEILRNHGNHLAYWHSAPDAGQCDALNKGFRMATGDIIGWLNADDRYLPGAIRTIAGIMSGKTDCDILYGDYRFIDATGNILRTRRELDFDAFMLKYLHILYIPTTASFFRRRIFDNGNFLDLSYHYAMDYEFFIRLASRGYKFQHTSRLLADFRWHQESKSSRHAALQRREMKRALLSHDRRLAGMPGIASACLGLMLMLAARAKRYALKTFTGAYWK